MSSDEGIAAFLAARLAEDERELAKDPPHGLGYANLPARMRREIEAKRAILAAHIPYVSYPDTDDPDGEPLVYELCAVCVTDKDGYAENWVMDQWPCLPVRALASIYSDHPDCRAEWKP